MFSNNSSPYTVKVLKITYYKTRMLIIEIKILTKVGFP